MRPAIERVVVTASGLAQFLPLSVFATYAFRHGPPTSQRWVEAFELAAVVALIQLVVLLPRRRPINRLILGANLYLLAGGAAAVTRQWWLLDAYGVLRESAIFLSMLVVGVVATLVSPAGYVGADAAPRDEVRWASLWLLEATLVATLVSLAFRGSRTWAAVVPMIALAVLQRALRSRLQARAAAAGASSPSAAAVARRVATFALAIVTVGLLSRALVGLASPGSASSSVYDDTELLRADYSGLPSRRMLLARDGTPLAVRVYPAPGATVVLAIHGSTGRGRYYHPLATYLSDRGHATVYALDLRGHGESGGRRGDVDYIGQLEDDLADVMAAIRRERPGARIVLAGHSAGGGLAVRYAGGTAGPRPDGYVLLAPYLGPDAAPTKPAGGGWVRADLPTIVVLSAKSAAGDTSGQDAVVLRFNQPAATADRLQVLAYTYRMMASLSPRRDLSRDLAALRQPLLVLVGARDESFHADRYEPTIAPHAKGTFTVLPDVSHLGLVVNRRTADEIAAWLGRQP
jgi:alpha-beta hydrolase superfamily lysophospholipase